MSAEARYAIQDLANLAEVSRRTVRYYVQEGLIPAPFGIGRGPHYGAVHLDHLLHVKELQAAGQSLDEIRAALRAGRVPAAETEASPPERSVWRRLQVAPGVEVHIAHDVNLPGPNRLRELAAWCRLHFGSTAATE